MTTHRDKRRAQALEILLNLLRTLQGITADVFYAPIREAGFTEEEAVKYTGAVMRTASANGHMEKTPFSKPSKRNSSNLQSVWVSKLFENTDEAQATNDHWRAKGYDLPDHEALFWKSQRQLLQQTTVSEERRK